MRFLQEFWLNMLGNGDSHLHRKLEAYNLSDM